MLPDWFTEYLSFHKKERRGILLLIVVILLLIGFNVYQRVFWKTNGENQALKFGPEIIAFKEKIDSAHTDRNSRKPWIPEARELFVFDPNTLDSVGWRGLGFTPKQTAAILKYRNAGAVFRKSEDLKKLFVVDQERYIELKPFISIAPIETRPTHQKSFTKTEATEKKNYEKVVIELNSADTSQFVKLYGIGPSYSKRIVKYRELLGGYLSKEQVLEVYGMDSVRYNKIEDQLLVDTNLITKININKADVKQLMRHPYLNINQAKSIVNYRKQHGVFKEVSELENIHLIKGETYQKIAPYSTIK